MKVSNKEYDYKISIGFPVNNVEDYVRRSLTSVLNQDFDDYKVLFIEKRGSNYSICIIQELVNRQHNEDKVNKIRYKTNNELAEVRNTAIPKAIGKNRSPHRKTLS